MKHEPQILNTRLEVKNNQMQENVSRVLQPHTQLITLFNGYIV